MGVQVTEARLLRVGFVASLPSPEHPAKGMFNLRAAQSLSQRFDLRIISLRSWRPGRPILEPCEMYGLKYWTLCGPSLPFRFPPAEAWSIPPYREWGWPAVKRVLAGCDIIHSVYAAFAGVLSSTWAKRLGVPHVTQVIGADVNFFLPEMKNSRAVRGWERFLHGAACNCRSLMEAFRRLYPEVPNVRVIHRGVDLTRFTPEGDTAGPLAELPGVRFLFIGGVVDQKNLALRRNRKGGVTLMQVWRELEDDPALQSASLLFAGEDTDSAFTRQWRAGLKHPERVILGGRIAPEFMPAYMRSADAVLVPSLSEGLPNAAMEAAACGKPVFGSAVDGIPDVIIPGQTGLLLPPGNVPAWKEAIRTYARKPDELKRMGVAARRFMVERFDARQFPENVAALYEAAVDLFRAENVRTAAPV